MNQVLLIGLKIEGLHVIEMLQLHMLLHGGVHQAVEGET